MRKEPNTKAERYRVSGPLMANCGAFVIGDLRVVVSNGGGWDHVSVSLSSRCPTWDEMVRMKELFFADDECVMQLHPPKSDYINCHPYCLHLWRPQTTEEITAIKSSWEAFEPWPEEYPVKSVGEIPRPPGIFVGIK